MEVEEVELANTTLVSNEPEQAHLPETDLEVEEIQPTPVATTVIANINSRATFISRYLTAVTSNAYEEYEERAKGVAYMVLIVLCVLVIIGWLYAHPGTGMAYKWRRSVRRLKRLSKNINSSFRGSWGFYPFVQDVVNVAHVVMHHFAD